MIFFSSRLKVRRLVVIFVVSLFLVIGGVITISLFFIHWLDEVAPWKRNQKAGALIGQEWLEIWPRLAGWRGGPHHVLLLLQNNTELRPSGGFVGAYAVVEIDRGRIQVLKTEGVEVLDAHTPSDWRIAPPAPIARYLKVDRWYFRDSNWSPDFAEAARQALILYDGEQGFMAPEIDSVIAVTPTVLEQILDRIGPVTIDGITFDAETAVATLQHEVEYGYKERAVTFVDRKNVLHPLFVAVLNAVKNDLARRPGEYQSLWQNLFAQKHIALYSTDPLIQSWVEEKQWGGRVHVPAGDTLLWVDANLLAWKTDHAIERRLTYTLDPSDKGEYVARAIMQYRHTGEYDWRTTKYRTYARLFAPRGSVLHSVMMKTTQGEWTVIEKDVDQGEELNLAWFGTSVAVVPGETVSLSFEYQLPSSLSQEIVRDQGYTLLVQKQAGTLSPGLTLDLDFGTNIRTATPEEGKPDYDSMRYQTATDLLVDREFTIHL